MDSFAPDRYRVVGPLGGGGMAEVFLAVTRGAGGFQKPVAIKRVLPHLAKDPNVAEMFLAEARLAMHLHHQNIVTVFDVGNGPEGLYLVMELVDGWDLAEVIGQQATAQRWMPEPLALYVGVQVANGLTHAYRKTENGRPIMAAHRDLSPSNVMVTSDGEVKIADFGIAKVESGHTEPGTFKGKVPYSAPEVVRGAAATHLSDQFSLGVVLHRLTTGEYPYGYFDNPVPYSEALFHSGPPPCIGLSPGFATALRRMLSVAADQRFASMEEVGLHLGNLLASSGGVAGPSQLAQFLSSMAMPPLPSSKVPRTLPTDVPSQLLPSQVVRPSSADGPTLAPSSFGQEYSQSDWQAPVGPSMDASGRVTHGGAASRPSFSPPAAPAREEPLELDRPSPPMPVEPDPSAQLWQPPPPPSAPTPVDPTPGYGTLPGLYGDKPRRRFPFKLLFVVLLLAGAGVAYLKLDPAKWWAKIPGTSRQIAVLTVLSEPPGAQVRLAGQVVGTTPWSQENMYSATSEIPVQLTLKGYKTWTGTFRGGLTVTVEANLRR